MATDGPRFVWSASSTAVIYSQKGRFYNQTGRGFVGEVTTYPLIEGARRAAPMARVAEIEIKLLMGIVAGTSGFGLATVIGAEIAQFVIENRREFDEWRQKFEAFLKARDFLKAHAPTLYEKVFNAVLSQLYKDVKSKLPDAVTAETVAFGVGVVLGSVGKKLARGRFSVLAVAFVVLEQIAIRFSLNVVPGAFKLTTDEYRKLANEIIGKMREIGVVVTETDVRRIVEEVNRHPEQIKRAFELLKHVFGR